MVQVVQVPHLHHLRRYNRRMTPRSICVLGGTGFVGTHLCASLTRAGHEVTVLTRNAARATGCDCTNAAVGTVTTAPGTRRFT